MIDWQSEELVGLKRSVRKFLSETVGRDWEERERSGEFALSAFRRGCELGYFTCGLPQKYGGIESLPALRVVAEELGRADVGFGLSVLAHTVLFGFNLARLGNDEQKDRLLPDIIAGRKIGAWALTEPSIGSDAASIKTVARRDGDGYILSGEKTFITNAPVADVFIVLARTSGTAGDFKGITAFLVDRHLDGVSVGKPFYKLGHRTSPTAEISFSEVRLSKADVLGTPECAFQDAKYSLTFERLSFGGLGQGIVDVCLEKSTAYALERTQFNQPIAGFQLIQEKLARMVAYSDVMRTYATHVFEKHVSGADVTEEAAILKLFLSKACMEVTSEAVQIFGGAGYLEETGVARFYRDAKLFEIGGGTSEIQTLIIAKAHLKGFGKGK